MAKQVATMLGDSEFDYISKAREKAGLSMYTFVKNAIMLAAERELNEPAVKSPLLEQMIEALGSRKRYLYQLGPYSDANHREWLSGRFTAATNREIREAVAQWRAAGGTT